MIDLATIDWGTAAAVIVALAAVAGIIIQAIKREKPWRKAQIDHNVRLTALEIQVKANVEKVDQLKEMIDDHDHRDEKDFERLEGKIEKLTDITISMLQSEPKAKPKPRSTKLKAK